jgi:hypothetical protein
VTLLNGSVTFSGGCAQASWLRASAPPFRLCIDALS